MFKKRYPLEKRKFPTPEEHAHYEEVALGTSKEEQNTEQSTQGMQAEMEQRVRKLERELHVLTAKWNHLIFSLNSDSPLDIHDLLVEERIEVDANTK